MLPRPCRQDGKASCWRPAQKRLLWFRPAPPETKSSGQGSHLRQAQGIAAKAWRSAPIYVERRSETRQPEDHCLIDAPSTRPERSELLATLSQAGGRRWSYRHRETRGSDGPLPWRSRKLGSKVGLCTAFVGAGYFEVNLSLSSGSPNHFRLWPYSANLGIAP